MSLGSRVSVSDALLDEDPSEARPSAQRLRTSLAVGLLCYSCVAGGPYGVEVAVQQGGALLTCVGLLAAGLAWGLPQALMTAELSSALPANGGPIVWVTRALGARWGFVNACLVTFNQVTDINLYPTLLASYVQTLFAGKWATDPYLNYALKLTALLFSAALNVVGVDALSASAAVLTAVIMLPFILMPIVASATGVSFDWAADGVGGIPPSFQAGSAVFFSTVLWNMQGWTELGALAGDIDNAAVVLPRGMILAACLVTICYAAPVLIGAALEPDLSAWGDGFFVTLSSQVAPWLGILAVLSAALANMSTLLTSMAAYARTLQATVRAHILPVPALGRNATRWRTPVPAIVALTISSALLMSTLNFSQLVVLDSSFYILGQVSVLLAFLRLRAVEPGLERPYAMPGGHVGAYVAVAGCLVIAAGALLATVIGAGVYAAAVGGALAVFIAASIAWDTDTARALLSRMFVELDKEVAQEAADSDKQLDGAPPLHSLLQHEAGCRSLESFDSCESLERLRSSSFVEGRISRKLAKERRLFPVRDMLQTR